MLPPFVDSEIEELGGRLRAVRHDLHRHPELGFQEVRTQGVVRRWLEELGYVPVPCAKTGLIADLHASGRSRTIALRADLDCLPIQEDTDLPYRSIHPGRAHKCGHDGHTAILLGVAAILARHRAEISGNVRLLFQPAEEGGGGGRVMVEEGAMNGVSEVYGLHNWPGWPKGEVRVKAGPMLAEVHRLEVEIVGLGGHGSQPQLCRDPIVAGAHLVSSLQTVVSRGLGYQGGAVVSICTFHAGTADNIIPRTARLEGTVRTFEDSTKERVLERIRQICEGTAEAFSVEIALNVVPGYPVVVNDPRCAEVVARVASEIVGGDKVSGRDLPMAGGEDFAYLARAAPGAYFFLGAREPGAETPVCHHPDFDFDDELIPLGIRMFLGIVLDRFREP